MIGSFASSIRIANSSPPNLATVSVGRTTEASLWAAMISSWSPAARPRLSLTVLNPSRSAKRTPTTPPERAARVFGLAQAVQEQGPVRQSGEGIVEGLVGGLLRGLRIVQRKAGMLGEGEDRVALHLAVSTTGPARPQRECAHQLASLIHGRGDHGPQPVESDVEDAPWVGLVVLDDDRPVLRDRVAGHPDVHVCSPDSVEDLRRVSNGRNDLDHGWLFGVDQAEVHELVTEQLAGAPDDCVENVLQVLAAGDGALQRHQPLEQPLSLAKLTDQLDASQRETEDLAHPPQQVHLPPRKALVPHSRSQKDGSVLPDRRGHPRAEAELPELSLEPGLTRGLDERDDRLGAGLETDRRHHPSVANHRSQLGVDRLGHPLDASLHRVVLVGEGGDDRQELCQLLGRPALGRDSHHATANDLLPLLPIRTPHQSGVTEFWC